MRFPGMVAGRATNCTELLCLEKLDEAPFLANVLKLSQQA